MRKLIASINMTLDGYCNHTAMVVTEELHGYFNEQMSNTGTILFGRVTYQLMEQYWPLLVKNPSGDKTDDEFALWMENIPKVVISKTLKNVDWNNSTLIHGNLNDEVIKLKQQPGKDIYVGSPSLIAQLSQTHLIDEYHLCIHPLILGSGLVLFKDIQNKINLRLLRTKSFKSGVVAIHYGCS